MTRISDRAQSPKKARARIPKISTNARTIHKNTIDVPSWMDFEPYNKQYIKIMDEINRRKS